MSKKSRQHKVKLRGAKDEMSLSLAFFQMSHLLNAGVSIEYCLEEIANQEVSWKLCRVWKDLARRVKEGQSLSGSMLLWPGIFNSTIVAIIKSGEISGELVSSLVECRKMIMWRAGVAARIQTVLVYPLFAFTVVVAVVIFLLVYLVPSLAGFIDDPKTTVIWHTRTLLLISNWLQENYKIGALTVASILGLTITCYALSKEFRLYIDRLVTQLPYAGGFFLGISLSRYCENCAKLYERGVTLDSAMRISEGTVANRATRFFLIRARQSVVAGNSFSASIEKLPNIPVVFLRMLKAGEASGELNTSMLQASLQQQQITDLRIDRIEKLIGPLLLILVGLVLLWIVISLLGPIYQSAVDSVMSL